MESRLRPRCLQMEYHMFLTHSNLLPQYRLANKKNETSLSSATLMNINAVLELSAQRKHSIRLPS